MTINNLSILPLALLAIMTLFIVTGCNAQDETAETNDAGLEETTDEQPEQAEDEKLSEAVYHPWLITGKLNLSTGETLNKLYEDESDSAHSVSLSKQDSFKGNVVWLVKESDVFAVEWLELSFSVHDLSYEEGQVEYDLFFDITIEGINPKSDKEGIQEFEVAQTFTEQGFTVTINRVILAKQQENTAGELIDYVALNLEMKAE
jgi:hypothetical protein